MKYFVILMDEQIVFTPKSNFCMSYNIKNKTHYFWNSGEQEANWNTEQNYLLGVYLVENFSICQAILACSTESPKELKEFIKIYNPDIIWERENQ